MKISETTLDYYQLLDRDLRPQRHWTVSEESLRDVVPDTKLWSEAVEESYSPRTNHNLIKMTKNRLVILGWSLSLQ